MPFDQNLQSHQLEYFTTGDQKYTFLRDAMQPVRVFVYLYRRSACYDENTATRVRTVREIMSERSRGTTTVILLCGV